ncbi:MAG: hypothetical protein RJA36_681 [Pseudomonadota bacterium]|jgi:iron complex outermembrane receptor protein
MHQYPASARQNHPFAIKPLLLALSGACGGLAFAQSGTPEPAPVKDLGVVTVDSGRPSSLPTQIPTTMEGISARQIEETVNAADSEDALKYFPSLLVRKRYDGDYNHAILSSRASGTGNSARSAVYADGILLSNYLGNGVSGLSFAPRWGLVTPEEIERVDVMYGPFSAAYPGNSAGAVVDYVTRMPTRFEARAKVSYAAQPFSLYGTDASLRSWQTSASVGNKSGDWSWLINASHSDNQGQPLTFASRTLASGTAGSAGKPVTGAVLARNTADQEIYVIGSGTQYHSQQDHLKLKLAYDVTPQLRASYVLGLWQNSAEGRPQSYLRDAAGQPVYSGKININGRDYAAPGAGDFPLSNESLSHAMHGFSLKSHTQGTWDWEVAASLYDYGRDLKRQNTTALPGAATGGAGTLADGSGTGWNTLDLKGTWRPEGPKGAHIVDMGWQLASYQLGYLTSAVAGNWITDPAGAMTSQVGGKTRLQSLYAQDSWAFAPRWKAVLGLRAEQWSARDGHTQVAGLLDQAWDSRSNFFASPKAALSYQLDRSSFLKASVGRAVRMPTVAELYGATSTTNSQYLNDPTLQPERSWTGELSYEKDLNHGLWRLTYFKESTRDGIYSQSIVDAAAGNKTISRVQNVGRVDTQGVETAFAGYDIGWIGLDLSASLTYAESIIQENDGFVSVPGDTIGRWQPNIPRWRATAVATYRLDDRSSATLAARYSGRQYRTLNNADVNGQAYMGVSPCFTVDVRLRHRIDRQWTAAFGIDNLNNAQYWNFHPYPQRTWRAELKYDL